jgi:DNA-binding transcriptional LysR family regulator
MDIDLRLVRYVVAVADELHFGKAAAQLQITEQTLSGQVKHFEEKLRVRLFVRDRRHVEVTAAGRVLVERGRRLLLDAQEMVAEMGVRPVPFRIDVLVEGLATPILITERALGVIDGMVPEIWAGQDVGAAVAGLSAGNVDIAFAAIPPGKSLPNSLDHMPVRLQPISLLLPVAHPLASLPEIAMERIRDPGLEILIQAQREAPSWQSWQEKTAAAFGWKIGGRVQGQGMSSVALTVLRTGQPTLTRFERPPHDGLTTRPLVDPVPLLAWSMLWRSQPAHPRIAEVLQRVEAFVGEQGWLAPPERAWWTQSPWTGGGRPAPAVEPSAVPRLFGH